MLAEDLLRARGLDPDAHEVDEERRPHPDRPTDAAARAALGRRPRDLRRPSRSRCSPPGGLCVIGTERHESRRIDNQLRGRSGRQGDPGITQFYLSLGGRPHAPVRRQPHGLHRAT